MTAWIDIYFKGAIATGFAYISFNAHNIASSFANFSMI
jgi:hypothetical protein